MVFIYTLGDTIKTSVHDAIQGRMPFCIKIIFQSGSFLTFKKIKI